MALTLALALWGAAGKPGRVGILVISSGIALCLTYAFRNWAWEKQRTPAEKIGRGVLLVVGCACAAASYGWQFYPPAPPPKPYELTNGRRAAFLAALKPPTPADTVRIGCIAWSERACAAAGQFLMLFSEAGWKIDQNRVFRMDAAIPLDGLALVTQPTPGPQLPPHLGRWHDMNLSQVTIMLAFQENGLATSASSDQSVTPGITGVYFGPEPLGLLSFDKTTQLFPEHLVKFVYEGRSIHDRKAESEEEAEWNKEVESWLRTSLGDSEADGFRSTPGIEAKNKYLLEIVKRLLPPMQQSTS